MSDIFKEVDDALQQDKITHLWKEHGGLFILAIIMLIGGTAVTTGYQSWDASRNQEETSKLLTALQSDEPANALKDIPQNTRSGQAAIARFVRAGILAQEGTSLEAANIYKEIYEDTSTPAPLDDFLRLSYVRTIISSDEPPVPPNLMSVLNDIISNTKSPYIYQAHLDAALIEGELNKNYNEALTHLNAVTAAQNIQQSLKDRAAKLTQLYTSKSKGENS